MAKLSALPGAQRSASFSSTMSAAVVASAGTVRAAQVQPARAAARQGAPALRRAFAGAQLVQAKQQQRAERAVGLQVSAAGDPKGGSHLGLPPARVHSPTIGRPAVAPGRRAAWADGPTLPPRRRRAARAPPLGTQPASLSRAPSRCWR